MIIPNPDGFTFYIGADGFDAFPDANGWLWFADDFKAKNYFKAHVYRSKDGITERISLPEEMNGAIRLNWTPAGLFASGSYQATEGSPVEARVVQITEFAQFTNNFPIVETITVEKTIDQGARDLYNATVALANTANSKADKANSLADTAYTVAKQAQNTAGTAGSVANTALAIANSKPSIDQVWTKINERLFALIQAIRTGDRSDALNAAWMDILFGKTNDWIYGWMKDHGFVK